MNFKGIITAIITPFKNGEVDYKSLKRLVEFQIQNGIDGIVVAGTTGESPTLSFEEKHKIFDFIKTEVAGLVPVIVGTGTNSTVSTIEMTQAAEGWGADGALVVVPYYNKPPQEGLFRHFLSVAQNTKLPIILYNVPSRTVASLAVETIVRLSEISNIVAIKEASGKVEMTQEILKKAAKDFIVLSGDDGTYLDLYRVGAQGVVSVLSNILPQQTKAWAKNFNHQNTLYDFDRYRKFIDTLFIEPNPIPIKMALYLKGLIDSPELRLPLVELSSSAQSQLKKQMQGLGIL